MDKADIMKCAAILAAGMIARDHESAMTAEDAVDLMNQLIIEMDSHVYEDSSGEIEWL